MMQAVVNLTEYRKTGYYNHIVTHATPGFMHLPQEARRAALLAFQTAVLKGDHHYTIELEDGGKVFMCENGEGYTAMLPEEY